MLSQKNINKPGFAEMTLTGTIAVGVAGAIGNGMDF